tara:strand:+ start:75 stop:263 length:189 start_codon:yes stop_codon:yes gene_type:complete
VDHVLHLWSGSLTALVGVSPIDPLYSLWGSSTLLLAVQTLLRFGLRSLSSPLDLWVANPLSF